MPARVSLSALAPVLLLVSSAGPSFAGPGLPWRETASPATPIPQPLPAADPLPWRPLPKPQPGLQFRPMPQQAPRPGSDLSSGLSWRPVPDHAVITLEAAAAMEPPPPAQLPEEQLPRWPEVRGLARGITVNGESYADTGLKVPNGFAGDPEYTVSASMVGTSRTRSCEVPPGGSWRDCADLEAYLDLIPFRWENASLGFQWTVQSLASRNQGTPQLAGQSLGFRLAYNLSPTTGLAFGGEHVLQLDEFTDLGRNFYLVLSQAIPLSEPGPDQWLAVATVGMGSDFYGYGNNGIFGSTDCLSGNNISSRNFPDGTDCFWGPIGALTVHMGPQVSVGAEWFGFGIGAGVSVRPLRQVPLTLSFYLTDFLGNVPSGIEELCTSDPCDPRLYGRITMSF